MAPDPTAAHDGEDARSPFPLLPLAVFVGAVLCIVLGASKYQGYMQTVSRHNAAEALEAIADLKVSQINAWRAERIGDARVLSVDLGNALRVAAFVESPSAGDSGEDILRFMEAFLDSYGYRSVALTTVDGTVRLSAGPDAAIVGPYGRSLIRRVAQLRRPLLSDFHRASNVEGVHLDLCAPILVRGPEGERCAGAYLLRIDPDKFLYPTVQDWPTPSPTAETLIVRREGDDALFLNELRHRKDSAMRLRLSIHNLTLPAAVAVLGYSGVMEGFDYRGVPVVAATRSIPETSWSLVAKVDSAEIYSPIRRQTRAMGIMVTGLVFIAGLLVTLWWREREAVLLKRRLAAESARLAMQELYLSERSAAEVALRASLAEKTTLLKELHHRVKNNMQVISSMLSMQAAGVRDPVGVAALRETQNRVRSMALLHETLYRSENVSRVDFAAYLNELCAHIFRSFGAVAGRIQLTMEVQRSTLSLDQAIPCGLIVNELISNSLKHAFPDGLKGALRVSFGMGANGRCELSVSDNGVGMAAVGAARANTLGLRLVQALAGQLRATVEWRRERGVSCCVVFQAQE